MTTGFAGKSKIAGIILAAGQSRRMGATNKLLAQFNNTSFVQTIARNALEAELDEIIVVTGHEAERIEAEVSGLNVTCILNKNFAQGLSSSLKVGVSALESDVDAVLILLADMPFITTDIIREVAASYDHEYPDRILVPYHKGKRGNPVLWPRQYFSELTSLTGDQGARQLLRAYQNTIHKLDLGKEVLIDIDTPEAAEAFGIKGVDRK